ncbi:MAG: penicillin-binding protein 2, partial [Candidatus Protistobacter heckmanni]|nr:penicillin-binding protein 2 [Candidatus Protistobacter heckmanni]
VSMPTFDPNLFIEGIDPDTWRMLNESPDRPLYNRPLKGIYPPGSTYKPFMALGALTTGERTPQQTIYDPGYFMFGNHQFRDDKPGGHGTVDMMKSIIESCDTYYYILARDMGVNAIHDFMKPFGFGQITGIDIIGETRGVLPSTEWKQKTYRKPEQQKWYPGETISLGIGQGYNSFTILQLAQAVSVLANGGTVMKPHLVKAVEDAVTRKRTLTTPKESYRIPLKPEHIDVIRKAMIEVNRTGTGANAFRGADYVAAGKTGTAQVFTIAQGAKTDAKQAKEHLRDHALYIAFAPADKPRVALALVVENSGFGAQFAAPIARRVFDYVLEGKWPDEVPPFPVTNPTAAPNALGLSGGLAASRAAGQTAAQAAGQSGQTAAPAAQSGAQSGTQTTSPPSQQPGPQPSPQSGQQSGQPAGAPAPSSPAPQGAANSAANAAAARPRQAPAR